MISIYLDVCCLGRLTDDQSQTRIAAEAVAVETILWLMERGELEWVTSPVLAAEIRRSASPARRIYQEAILATAQREIAFGNHELARALELASLGYGTFDAMHLAAAESAAVDCLLTTDDRFLRRVSRGLGSPRVPAQNPLRWLKERK
jgi:hypothetical protein